MLVGPNRDQPCTVDADLYTPEGASKAKPVPAIMGTNGFGGSKDDFDNARHGLRQARLRLPRLLRPGLRQVSGCKITLDDREHDGNAGSQLVSFLGGSKAADDGTKIDYIVKDAGPRGAPHRRPPRRHDRRLLRRADPVRDRGRRPAAGHDHPADHVERPVVLAGAQQHRLPHGVTYSTPGVAKIDWPVLFFGARHRARASPPRWPTRATPAPARTSPTASARRSSRRGSTATSTRPASQLLRNASVSSYYDEIRIPMFLTQGQSDNLFNLQESVATYKALRAQGTP